MISWSNIYCEAELYKAAVALYTRPIFNWKKALSSGVDQKNFYDFASVGLRGIDKIHRKLRRKSFQFGNAKKIDYQFNSRMREIYIYSWEDRLVDLALFRMLNQAMHHQFAQNSYAYRAQGFGIDCCQKDIVKTLHQHSSPHFLIKRDIVNYFGSIDHQILLDKLAQYIDPHDYLFKLLEQRVRFSYEDEAQTKVDSVVGVPFGTSIAGLLANIYFTKLDHQMKVIKGLKYFRYADDFLILCRDQKLFNLAKGLFADELIELKLTSKKSHEINLEIGESEYFDHLGVRFFGSGHTKLTVEKQRKIQNLFKYALRRKKSKILKIKDPHKRAKLAVTLIKEALEKGMRNVGIIDYYLRHSKDEAQLKSLDLWLAQLVLKFSLGNGNKKGNFKKISFQTLRKMGLPSLVHRRRLLAHSKIDSPFFIWNNHQKEKGAKAFHPH
jgi:retron-type reverse transcriptase